MTARAAAILWVALLGVAASVASAEPERADSEVEAEIQRLRSASLAQFVERSRRLVRVSDALRVAGGPLCGGKLSPVLGVVATSQDDLPWPLRKAAARDLGVGEAVQVLSAEPGHAAFDAGIRPGDVVSAIEGEAVEEAAALGSRHAGRLGATLRIDILRTGVTRTVSAETRLGCFTAATLLMNDQVNAYMGKGRVYATSGLMRFVANDDELAVIVGHEIAHHILSAGGTSNSESDADYLGLYIAARAGFDASVAPGFWRRWTLRSPLMIHEQRRSSHPSSHERALALEATLLEIEGKRAAGLELTPERPR